MEAECITQEAMATALKGSLSAERFGELLEGQEGTFAELEAVAKVLHVRLSDLHVSPLEEHEEVVITRTADSQRSARHLATYRVAPLARTRHQPDLKTFDLEVLASAQPGETMRCGLHTFVYHFGSEPVELSWDGRGHHAVQLRPGDSAYIAPLTAHRFSAAPAAHPGPGGGAARGNPNGAACGQGRRLFLVRIPGHLSGETLSEFATFSAGGRERVGAETLRWYS